MVWSHRSQWRNRWASCGKYQYYLMTTAKFGNLSDKEFHPCSLLANIWTWDTFFHKLVWLFEWFSSGEHVEGNRTCERMQEIDINIANRWWTAKRNGKLTIFYKLIWHCSNPFVAPPRDVMLNCDRFLFPIVQTCAHVDS